MALDPATYTVTEQGTGVYLIEMEKTDMPADAVLIIIEVEYAVPATTVTHYGTGVSVLFK